MKDEKLYRGYKVRLFPTPEQEELMRKHSNTCRFIWNYMLETQIARYKINNKSYMDKYDMCKEITYMKKECEYNFIKQTPLHSMQQVCNDLNEAFICFFKNTHGMPKFKKEKNCKVSFPLDPDSRNTYFKNENVVHVQKVGDVKYKTDFTLPIGRGKKISDPQIYFDNSSKKWMLTFGLKRDKQANKLTNKEMGIDLGIEKLATISFGKEKIVYENINKSKRMRSLQKKLKHIKRVISRKQVAYTNKGHLKKGEKWSQSKNIEEYKQILREIETKMSNIRHNYIHKITKELVEMKPKRVVMEGIIVSNMMKDRTKAKLISDCCWNMFIETMRYKCEEYGIEFVQADKFFPSSKLCSCCGHKKKDLKLSDRVYICPNCGLEIDRDYNAAINLMNYTENENTTSVLVSTQKSGSTLVA